MLLHQPCSWVLAQSNIAAPSDCTGTTADWWCYQDPSSAGRHKPQFISTVFTMATSDQPDISWYSKPGIWLSFQWLGDDQQPWLKQCLRLLQSPQGHCIGLTCVPWEIPAVWNGLCTLSSKQKGWLSEPKALGAKHAGSASHCQWCKRKCPHGLKRSPCLLFFSQAFQHPSTASREHRRRSRCHGPQVVWSFDEFGLYDNVWQWNFGGRLAAAWRNGPGLDRCEPGG